jgi:hypothetical protein
MASGANALLSLRLAQRNPSKFAGSQCRRAAFANVSRGFQFSLSHESTLLWQQDEENQPASLFEKNCDCFRG